jgi:DNA-binding transcriptional regulator YiaG
MFHPQHHLLARDVGEHEVAQLQSQEAQAMTPATPFALLAERCGLSQREAAEFLKVRLDTVKSWCAGRNVAKPAVLAELRGLYANIQAAADKLAQDNERLLEQQRERGIQQRGIVFGLAETDDVARAYGFPSQGPYMAAIGLAQLRLPNDVSIVMQSQSYPGTGGGAAPVVPGTELTWPPSRKASRKPMGAQEKTATELADIVAAKVNLGGVAIAVHPDPAYGWHATVLTAPAQAVRCQQYVEQIVAELRPFYRLKG